MSVDVELLCTYTLSTQINVWNDGEGFTELQPFRESCEAFFKLAGASVIMEEFWANDEGKKFATRVEGYNVTVIFQGELSYLNKASTLVDFFLYYHNAVKGKEVLKLVPKNDNS